MTPADIETLVALVERWQQSCRNLIATSARDDEMLSAASDLLAWKRPAPADTPPEIQVGDVW